MGKYQAGIDGLLPPAPLHVVVVSDGEFFPSLLILQRAEAEEYDRRFSCVSSCCRWHTISQDEHVGKTFVRQGARSIGEEDYGVLHDLIQAEIDLHQKRVSCRETGKLSSSPLGADTHKDK